jgi:tRNA (cmo5U34)-methyltransferase
LKKDVREQKNVKEQFDKVAGDYDRNRRKVIPCFDAFYGTGIDFLEFDGKSPKVLDIGAGTGLFSANLVVRYPSAELTLIDFSDDMLELARERFVDRANTHYILDNYFTHEFKQQSFDIVISALSIHHLNADEKSRLYQIIFKLLNRGGEFVNADQIISEYPEVQAKYEEKWIDFVKNNGFSEGQLAGHLERMSIDNPSPIGKQIEWMQEAGFAIAECLFKASNFAVLYGKK